MGVGMLRGWGPPPTPLPTSPIGSRLLDLDRSYWVGFLGDLWKTSARWPPGGRWDCGKWMPAPQDPPFRKETFEIIRKTLRIYWTMFELFWTIGMVNLWKRYRQKHRRLIPVHGGLKTFRFVYGRTPIHTLISMISGFWDASPSAKTNITYVWRPQGTSNNQRKTNTYRTYFLVFMNLNKTSEIHNSANCGKDGRRHILTIRRKTFWGS